MKWTKRRWS